MKRIDKYKKRIEELQTKSTRTIDETRELLKMICYMEKRVEKTILSEILLNETFKTVSAPERGDGGGYYTKVGRLSDPTGTTPVKVTYWLASASAVKTRNGRVTWLKDGGKSRKLIDCTELTEEEYREEMRRADALLHTQTS